MKFLLDLYRKATKGDSFRPTDKPKKYFDQISILNANPTSNVTSGKLNSMSKTSPIVGAGTTQGKLPGE